MKEIEREKNFILLLKTQFTLMRLWLGLDGLDLAYYGIIFLSRLSPTADAGRPTQTVPDWRNERIRFFPGELVSSGPEEEEEEDALAGIQLHGFVPEAGDIARAMRTQQEF